MKTILAIGLFLLGGCATGRSGSDLFADGIDCVADFGLTDECMAKVQHGLAQSSRSAGGLHFGPDVSVSIQ